MKKRKRKRDKREEEEEDGEEEPKQKKRNIQDDDDYDDDDDEEEEEKDEEEEEEEDEKGSLDAPEFREGKIVRIKLHNFMTYNDIEIKPGPGLNLVLGPNGSGKSSLVNAFCIGLGGHQRVLGRSSNIKDFVKHSSTEGTYIEIELYRESPKENLVVKRIIKNNISTWKINGKNSTGEKVKKKIKKMNIQFDNLTQFLPQDRVSEFAGLTAIQKLEFTQKTILEPQVIEFFENLIETQRNTRDQLSIIENKENTLEILIQKNKRLENAVKQYYARLEHIKLAEQLEVKIKFVRFSSRQAEAKEVKIEYNKSKEELNKFLENETPLRRKITEIKQEVDKYDKEKRVVQIRLKKVNLKIQKICRELTTKSGKTNDLQNELSSLMTRAERNKRKRHELNENIAEYKEKLESLTSLDSINSKITELTKKLKKIKRLHEKRQGDREELDFKRDEITDKIKDFKDELRKIQDVERQKRRIVRSVAPIAYHAYNWVLSKKQNFREKVYFVPLNIDIVKNEHAAKLESAIPYYLFRSLIVTNDHDRKYLFDNYIDKQKLYLNVIKTRIREVKNPMNLDSLKKYHAVCYLDSVFKAEPVVTSTLANCTNCDKIIIVNSEEKIMKMFNETRINSVYSEKSRWGFVRSEYSTKTVTSVSPFRLYTKLFVPIDKQRESQIKNEITSRETEVEDFDRRINKMKNDEFKIFKDRKDIESEISELKSQRKKVIKITKKIQYFENQLEGIQEEDVKSMEKGLLIKLRKNNRSRIEKNIELNKTMKEYLGVVDEFVECELMSKRFSHDLQVLLNQQKDEKVKLSILESKCNTLRAKFESMKENLKAFKDMAVNAKRKYIDEKMKNDNLSMAEKDELFKQILINLPDDLNTLEQKYKEAQEAADRIIGDRSVVIEFENRKKEIDDLQTELTQLKTARETVDKRIRDLEKKWVEPLQKKIDSIGEKFRTLCKNIGIAGEIKLKVDRKDYSQSSIEILVKFRDKAQLTELSSGRQSGGEKSVTTILYLLSLQNETNSPFFMVDEINQGMDPTNERKVFLQQVGKLFLFKLIKKKAVSSNGKDAPQSFLISPKLLPDLVPHDAKNINIFFIYNGMFNIDQKSFKKFHKNAIM